TFLVSIQPPTNLTRILSWQFWWLGDRFLGGHRGTGTIEAVLSCGVRWEETNPEELTRIRQSLLKADDYALKRVLSRLGRPEVCAPEIFQELIRTPKMRRRALALDLVKKPVTERERRRAERGKQSAEVMRLTG